MTPSRIKDPALGSQIAESEIAWLRYVMPVTEHYFREVSARDYSGKKLACWMHITRDVLPLFLALSASGAEIVVGACNVDSTDDSSAAYLSERGHHRLRLARYDPGRL